MASSYTPHTQAKSTITATTGDEITFMDVDLFIKIAFNITNFTDHHVPMDFTNKLHNLVKLTCLSNLTLVQALFYLKTIQNNSSSCLVIRKEGINALFRKFSLLLMISNKYLDDYSFNLKTWISLTNLSKDFIVSQEIKLLKKLDYRLNDMFHGTAYTEFVEELKRYVYTPLTPDSPSLEINIINSFLNYEQQQQQQQQQQQYQSQDQYTVPFLLQQTSLTTPPYSCDSTYACNYSYVPTYATIPAMVPPVVQPQVYSVAPASQGYTSYNALAYHNTPVSDATPSITSKTSHSKKRSYNDSSYSNEAYTYYSTPAQKNKRLTHNGDCTCCKMTNAANDYYSQYKTNNIALLVPAVYQL